MIRLLYIDLFCGAGGTVEVTTSRRLCEALAERIAI